jgi:hypothetical protein
MASKKHCDRCDAVVETFATGKAISLPPGNRILVARVAEREKYNRVDDDELDESCQKELCKGCLAEDLLKAGARLKEETERERAERQTRPL